MERDKTLCKAFGSELAHRRRHARLSQEAFADVAGVNRTFVAKLELGETQPSLTTMYYIAKALSAELPDLIKATLVRYEIENSDIRSQSKRVKRRHIPNYVDCLKFTPSKNPTNFLPWSGQPDIYNSYSPGRIFRFQCFDVNSVKFELPNNLIPLAYLRKIP